MLGRRRMVIRVIARTKATTSAPRPTSCAPTTEEPSGSAEVSATARVAALLLLLPEPLGDGLIVGNRPAALPPGVRVGVAVGMLGRLPTGSGDVVAAGTAGPVMATVAVACGSVGR